MKQISCKTKVMVFGTFDLLHKGHIFFINTARGYGDLMRIIVARDLNVYKIKNKYPFWGENKRVDKLQDKFSDCEVVLGDLTDFYKPIKDFQPEIICLGYDQVADIDELTNRLEKNSIKTPKIVVIKPYKPEIYKTSKINRII